MIRDWTRLRPGLYEHKGGAFLYRHMMVGGGADWYLVLPTGIRLQPPFDSMGEARTWYDKIVAENRTPILLGIENDALRITSL